MIKTELFNLPIKHRLFVFNYVNLLFSAISNSDGAEIKRKEAHSYLQKHFPERPQGFSNFPIGQHHINRIYHYFFGDRALQERREYAFHLGTHCPDNQYRLLEHILWLNPTLLKGLVDITNLYNLLNPNHYLIITTEYIFLKSKYLDLDYDCDALYFEFSWLLRRLHNFFNLSPKGFSDIEKKKNSLSVKLMKNDFKLKSKRPDKNLQKILHRQAYQTLKQLFGFDYTSLKNQQLAAWIQYLLQNIQGKQIGIREVAAHFGLSERTLQRRLEIENLSFTQLTQFLKNEVAKQMLEVPIFKVTDIAQSLGYSESSAFTRAFKKNTGTSPLKYRKQFIHSNN